MLIRCRIGASQPKAVVRVKRGLPGNAAHLPAEGARLEGGAVVGVFNHVELPGLRWRRCFDGVSSGDLEESDGCPVVELSDG